MTAGCASKLTQRSAAGLNGGSGGGGGVEAA